MSKIKKIPTLIAMFILMIGTFVGATFLKNVQVFKIGANTQSTPKNVSFANIGDTSLTVSWTSDVESYGFVKYGNTTSLGEIAGDTSVENKSFTHTASISGLKPDTKYFFTVNSDGAEYDNNGTPWQITTGPAISNPNRPKNISGNVISATGEPVEKALVYVKIAGYLLSTSTSKTGNFVLQVSSARNNDLKNYVAIDDETTMLEILVQQNSIDMATATAFVKSANPLPSIIIGQSQDFRNQSTNDNSDEPVANIVLPKNTEEISKFLLPDLNIPNQATKVVTIESLDEGETITSTTPEFGGDGPKGEILNITVESENPMTADVKVASDGSWKWEVPEGLAQGAHKITVRWKENGITRTLTKNFIVQAGELPAFEASNSGSIATPTPTAIPTSTAKSTATSKSTTTPSATPIPVPETGTLTGTVLLSIMGILAICMAIFNYKYLISDNE